MPAKLPDPQLVLKAIDIYMANAYTKEPPVDGAFAAESDEDVERRLLRRANVC
jgi:hypothetical protein